MQFLKDVKNIAYTAKFWTAVAGAVLLFLSENYADKWWVQTAIGLAALFGVYRVPNAKK